MDPEQQNDLKLHTLLHKGKLAIPGTDFENRVMTKVFFASQHKKEHKKNIRLSWLFLLLSAVFFPIGILSFLQKMNLNFSDIFGRNMENAKQFVIAGVVLLFCILLLLQIDNLLRLTLRARWS